MITKHLSAVTCFIFLIFALFGCGDISSSGSSGRSDFGGGGSTGGGALSVMLSWDARTTNEDGSPLTDLAGYKTYYGSSSGHYTQHVNVGNDNQVMIDGLTSGSWCFALTAYDTSGTESSYSNEVCTTL
jgi:hypothetical protein